MPSIRREATDIITIVAQGVVLIAAILFLGNLLSPKADTGPHGNPMTAGMECQQYAQAVVCR
ncbi:hypothetical protein [Mesorhizobium sp. M0767]|uniref:hypothetical protein n=1 Tax=Mesorhizobium sp. M0767 TaxID=2956995 RepID=UPI0033359E4C